MMIRPTILIVEDEVLIAESIISALKHNHYQILGYVTNGVDAIRSALSKHPDVILMDIHLKDKMSGIEAAETICLTEHIPIVFLTANAEALQDQEFENIKYHDLITKPFYNNHLYNAINRACKWSFNRKRNLSIDVTPV